MEGTLWIQSVHLTSCHSRFTHMLKRALPTPPGSLWRPAWLMADPATSGLEPVRGSHFRPLYFMTVAWSIGKVERVGRGCSFPFLPSSDGALCRGTWGGPSTPSPPRWNTIRWAHFFVIFFSPFNCSEKTERKNVRRSFTIFAFALAAVSVLQYFLGNGRIYWLFEPAETAGLGPS